MKIPFNKPFIAGKELEYISRAVTEEGRISGDGVYTRLCHEWLEKKLGCPRALLTHSCTAALEMAAILCDVRPGDEVIMPSFTFVSTANAFVLRGAVPVFVDIRKDTLNIDETLIPGAVTPRTRAIVAMHYAGTACNMTELTRIADEHDLYLIEDAAQAMLSSYKGRYLGTIGDMGCLSFHETKNIISGEGGSLLINDPSLVERAEIIREKGTNRSRFFRGEVDKYTWVDIGSSYLPSELVGAFLWAQLEKADSIIAKRRHLFRRYLELLQPLERSGCVRLPFVDEECSGNGHIFYILTNGAEVRDALIRHLGQDAIKAVFHYVPLHSSPAGIRVGRSSGSMEVTDDVSQRLLRLPLFYELNEADVHRIVESIEAFFIGRAVYKR
ncbi:MAG: dTDP-4-amino-4,6-dideoxygalactose transaminase [Proteobacteria bacterium]|nr:dTDP-4-amino-4,6-dideoxygalactose transaminase [Pseudomonadota bacterium]